MLAGNDHTHADEQTVELIAARVTAALRDELEAMLIRFARPATSGQSLTVEQLATRLGVARSTVYAHWREWGGYKLGPGKKAPIRFDHDKLPLARLTTAEPDPRRSEPPRETGTRNRRRRELITDAPRMARPQELRDTLA
jgi:hypothetical protein